MGIRGHGRSSQRERSKVYSADVPPARSLNALCLCGVIIGVAAVFCAWMYHSEPDYFGTRTLWDSLTNHNYGSHALLVLGGLIFMVGTVVAVITPLSGFVQVIGLSVYAYKTYDLAAGVLVGETGLWVGFYAGVASAVIVLVSLWAPMGPGFLSRPSGLRARLLVFSGFGARDPARSGSSFRGIGKAVLANRKWTSLLLVVMLASTFLVVHDRDFFRDEDVLTAVGGGILLYPCSPDLGLGAYGPWESYRISMYQGDSGVGWTFQNDGLDDGTWSVLSLGKETLLDLNVSLTVVDKAGDGMVRFGDYIVVAAQDGTAFLDDVVYRLCWRSNASEFIDGYWGGWEVSFAFHEGHLDSWVSEAVRYGLYL